jgi:hypothetical protein
MIGCPEEQQSISFASHPEDGKKEQSICARLRMAHSS